MVLVFTLREKLWILITYDNTLYKKPNCLILHFIGTGRFTHTTDKQHIKFQTKFKQGKYEYTWNKIESRDWRKNRSWHPRATWWRPRCEFFVVFYSRSWNLLRMRQTWKRTAGRTRWSWGSIFSGNSTKRSKSWTWSASCPVWARWSELLIGLRIWGKGRSFSTVEHKFRG